jgi:signal transduction histidine kinase
VFAEDRVTPVPPEDQMMALAARGEYFDSRMYVIGSSSVLVTARPVVNAEGTKIGSAFVSKDITELADSLRVREEFLSVVSHELRTPLTSIMGYLEVLEDDLDDDGSQVYIDAMARNSRKLLARIDDLLHVADPHRTLAYAEVDVPAMVASCVDDFRLRGSVVTLTSPDSFTASIDEARIRQVLDNLLSNAVKYSTGEVRATVSVDGGNFVVSVTDEGFGIAEHELKHVFDRFYRTESVRDAVIQGTGLGLSIVHDIVEAHGGTIAAESRLGVGSTFTVTLPMRVLVGAGA